MKSALLALVAAVVLTSAVHGQETRWPPVQPVVVPGPDIVLPLTTDGTDSPRHPEGYQWGLPGDVPILGDFDGDKLPDLTVYRPRTGQWFIRFSVFRFDRTATAVYQWGLPGDVPMAADYNGDGIGDLAVFRPASGTWFIRYSHEGGLQRYTM